jgi:hypothetical protein
VEDSRTSTDDLSQEPSWPTQAFSDIGLINVAWAMSEAEELSLFDDLDSITR